MRYPVYTYGWMAFIVLTLAYSGMLGADEATAPVLPPHQEATAVSTEPAPKTELRAPKAATGQKNVAPVPAPREGEAETPAVPPAEAPETIPAKGAPKAAEPALPATGDSPPTQPDVPTPVPSPAAGEKTQKVNTPGGTAAIAGEAQAPAQTPEPPRAIEPVFSRSLTMIQTGHNDANPMWSPNGDLLAFERGVGDKREIIIAQRNGSVVQTIYFETPEDEDAMQFFFPGITDTASYNAGMSWSTDGRSLAFMSNAGSGNYDLYLLTDLGREETVRLTQHPGKDSHPHWSPIAGRLVFVSGRTGKANIFSMDLITRRSTQLTNGPKMYLYPQWSPDGQQIAMIYGANENHDIYLIQDLTQPFKSTRALTTWAYDDLRPIWSPDGRKIAFYSNYNPQGDQKLWSIIVVAADGSDPTEGAGLIAKVVARQVIPDIEQGPAWMPDSQHIVYIKNDEQAFNPIHLVNIDDKKPTPIETGTKMNHDVTCAKDGTLAFRAQVEQWDHIYIAQLGSEPAPQKEQP